MINTSMKKLTEKSSICKVDDFFRAAPSYGTGAVWKRTGFDVFSVWLYLFIYIVIALYCYILRTLSR